MDYLLDSDCSSSDSSSDEEEELNAIIAVVKRRRLMCAAALAICLEEEENHSRESSPRTIPTRKNWLEHVAQVGRRVFKKMYRLDLENFNRLLGYIRDEITTENVEMARRSSGSEVCAEVRLAMTLRYLAGGSMWDIRLIFDVSHDEFYRSVWRVVDAINNYEGFKVVFPIDDVEKLSEIESVFRSKSSHEMITGCVGAIDGCLLWQKNPGIAVHNPNRYYCARKEKHALLLMAIVDADRRIIFYDISCTPSTHDSLAWDSTPLAQRFAAGDLCERFFIFGDSAFVCTRSMITPGNDTNFNYFLSELRVNSECAFGEMIRRWGILWRPLEMEFSRRADVIACCIRLHNFCVDRRLSIEAELMADEDEIEIQPGRRVRAPRVNRDGQIVENVQTNCTCITCIGSGRDRAVPDKSRRKELEAVVRNSGYCRPLPRR
mmetsp:Transcript_14721/g.19568  ORF Transcript_14721/g.19568 Transcript_14721/m.19568 type:complete len:434 (-) Transcript_14721:134-1435(-)|eukprot:CAMPEP_0197325308 /NCGR_PEP_ID=MMETSP0892-20130614/248_1 /TAXON_ID=44058 ORGANISM="Aureoumbra lagunensis, Strain CCMP1510" /NCGR_SAMPLE_ID=MMETSP0892 /ASSEMBLY_ACC=CAM_ASM_000538 /LENGTH=433 /DNA_ID=CAMNT_0042818391 /DNA_START=82 /DNA_END=1383 /DNA_ORIENTATION=-